MELRRDDLEDLSSFLLFDSDVVDEASMLGSTADWQLDEEAEEPLLTTVAISSCVVVPSSARSRFTTGRWRLALREEIGRRISRFADSRS